MLPKLIEVGGFFLPTYGVLVALAFLAGLMVTTRLAATRKLSKELITNLVVYCALAGMAGAKLFMFLFDWNYYAANPKEIFSFTTLQAAGVFQGGVIVALIVAWWYMKRHNLPFLATADMFAPGLAIGHGIGRLGCFAAGCCWGDKCDLPWAVTFTSKEANKLTGVPLNTPLHPTQIYESIAEFVIFVLLINRYSKPHKPGAIIGLYMVAYSLVRFGVEFVRNHEQSLVVGLSLTQWISLALLGLGVTYLVRRRALVA